LRDERKGELRMLNIIFFIALIWVTWKLIKLGIKLAWSITKFIFSVLVFPIIMIVLVSIGLISLAIPILIIVGIFTAIRGR